MSKKIKVQFDKEEKKIIILENAEKDDYFFISDLLEFNNVMVEELRDHIINEYKNNTEYKVLLENKTKKELLENEINSLKKDLEIEKEKIRNNLEREFYKLLNEQKEKIQKQKDDEILSLKNEKNKLQLLNDQMVNEYNEKRKIEIELFKANTRNELEKEFNEKINNIQLQIQKKEHDFEIEKINLMNEYEAKIENEKQLREQNSLVNIKAFGENFENWCQKQYDDTIGSVIDDCLFEKATKAVQGRKPDFIFTVFDKPISDNSKIELGKVVLEMKTEQSTSMDHTKRKNVVHLEKLKIEMKDNNASIGLLVSELESNDHFLIRKAPCEYGDIYIVRPSVFVGVLNIIRRLFILQKDVKIQEYELKNKNDIINAFDELKNNILECKDLSLLEKSVKRINDSSEIIIAKATDIASEVNEKIKVYFERLVKKIDDFEIKVSKKIIEKLQ